MSMKNGDFQIEFNGEVCIKQKAYATQLAL